jgi:2-polyprenyl-3-methyl-5-hydroxy-6-metoxy-1,4-benzoquinol methylase|tara:strand:+ start:2291 stop:3199 length:909 start_codon:yes stop_codon:yes gene_type:complete
MSKNDSNLTVQQRETLFYFRHKAEEWYKKANLQKQNGLNIIQERNAIVMEVLNSRQKVTECLDVGCGTGELVCEISDRGINALGIDFAEEMIKIAIKQSAKRKCTCANFQATSFFDYSTQEKFFDLISANGFIEYISYKEMLEFFDKCNKMLVESGSLVFSVRNRLFNIWTLNEYTDHEISENTLPILFAESIALTSDISFEQFKNIDVDHLPAPHFKTSKSRINVSVRNQYTPLQLINILRDHDYKTINIYPVHVHGVFPTFKESISEFHEQISLLIENKTESKKSLIPFSSTFMVNAIKY